jgi:hypothetical protein
MIILRHSLVVPLYMTCSLFSIRLSLFNCYLHDDNSIDFFLEIENWKLTTTTARYPIKSKKLIFFLLDRIFHIKKRDDDDDDDDNHAATK